MAKLTYTEMYAKAAKYIKSKGGKYKGYSGANALSLYVNDKFNVNAVDETAAGDALREAMRLLG